MLTAAVDFSVKVAVVVCLAHAASFGNLAQAAFSFFATSVYGVYKITMDPSDENM